MRRIWTWSGDGPTVTPLTARATNRGHSAGSSTIDGQPTLDRIARLRRIGLGEADVRPGHRRDLAGEADHRERVAAVRLDVDVEHDVAVEVRQRRADRGLRREDEDAVPIGGQPQLVAGAQHAVARDAHLLGALDPAVARQDRARQRHRDALAGSDVRGAADDLERLATPHGHPRERQAVGPRMGLHAEELADDDVLPVRAPTLEALDLHPEQRQPLGELLRRELDVDVVAEPGQRHSHRNCPRKRRSFSMYRRRSPTLWRRFAMRSTPIPKAKPW